MKDFLSQIAKHQALIYKVFLFIASTFIVIYLLPKGGQFKYNFQKGKPWQYENLYAPFSFAIKKGAEAIKNEQEEVRANSIPYFEYNTEISSVVLDKFVNRLEVEYVDSLYETPKRIVEKMGTAIIKQAYEDGVTDDVYLSKDNSLVHLKKGNEIEERNYSHFLGKRT